MKNSKFLKKGRKWVFTLALFLLVFAAASAVKIHAAGNVTGWLWGGSEDANIGGSLNTWPPDGNETGVGEIRMSGKTQDGLHEYGVNFPSSDGLIAGGNNYAWSENIGWIDFEGVNVTTVGSERRLSGQARVIAIGDAGINAGGWQGWIKMNGSNYQVDIDPATGKFCSASNPYKYPSTCDNSNDTDKRCHCYAWNGEEPGTGANMANGLGGIDFSGAKIGPSPSACAIKLDPSGFMLGSAKPQQILTWTRENGNGKPITITNSNSDNFEIIDNNNCNGKSLELCTFQVKGKLPLDNGKETDIHALAEGCTPGNSHGTIDVSPSTPCACGSADGKRYCNEKLTDSDPNLLCSDGILSSFDDTKDRNYEWYCGSCSCSAPRTCGWIETNP